MECMYPTHLIYKALGSPEVKTEQCEGICAFCGTEITEGVLLKESVSETFTNYDLLIDRTASHVCRCCYACLKDARLRRMNFIATPEELIIFKRDQLEHYLFEPPSAPFVFSVTISMKKHASFKARVNFSRKMFYVQKEDEQILFSPAKYREIYDAMKRLYTIFSKSAIQNEYYLPDFIRKYGLQNFVRDEGIIKNERGTQQFNLLIYSLNMSEEQLKKMKERKAKKEKENEVK